MISNCPLGRWRETATQGTHGHFVCESWEGMIEVSLAYPSYPQDQPICILAQFTGTGPLWHMVPINCIFAWFLIHRPPRRPFNLTTPTSLQRNFTYMSSHWGMTSALFKEDLLVLLVSSELEIHRKQSGRSERQRDETGRLDANICKMTEQQGRSHQNYDIVSHSEGREAWEWDWKDLNVYFSKPWKETWQNINTCSFCTGICYITF